MLTIETLLFFNHRKVLETKRLPAKNMALVIQVINGNSHFVASFAQSHISVDAVFASALRTTLVIMSFPRLENDENTGKAG